MSTTTWTLEDVKTLEAAIAKGALIVKYEDKQVTYRSLDEMLKILDLMKGELGLSTRPRGLRRMAQTSKGL